MIAVPVWVINHVPLLLVRLLARGLLMLFLHGRALNATVLSAPGLERFVTRYVTRGPSSRAREFSPDILKESSFRLKACGRTSNARRHRRRYVQIVSEDSTGKYPVIVYATARPHPRRPDELMALQYWYCYFYNDWDNWHEVDWENVTIILERNGAGDGGPEVADSWQGLVCAASNHVDGRRAKWDQVLKNEGGDRPLIFVARGSHGQYFRPGRFSPRAEVGGLTIRRVNLKLLGPLARLLIGDPMARDVTPENRREYYVDNIRLEEIDEQHPPWWLDYAGLWGAPAERFKPATEASRGPRFQPSTAWPHPFDWVADESSDWEPGYLDTLREL